METIYTLSEARQQQALGKIIAAVRMAASSRKSIYSTACVVLKMSDDEILNAFDQAGAPGLPDGFGGDAEAFAAYCRNCTLDVDNAD